MSNDINELDNGYSNLYRYIIIINLTYIYIMTKFFL
jgi:hypothetical protein